MKPTGPTSPTRRSLAKIAAFVGLTFAIAAVPYVLMFRTGTTRDYALLWMWSPGIAALATQLIFEQSIRGLGWRLPSALHLFVGFAVPLAYSTLIYVTVWVTRLGTFHGQPPGRVLLFATVGLLAACFAALGEEIGWRGLLVPELARIVSFGRVAAITGAVWALWHFPTVLFGDYHSEAPRWLDALVLSVAVLGFSYFTAWLRLRSESIWPCVIWHGAHNLLVQQIFYDLTAQSEQTHYFIDDFGLGVLIASLILGALAWRAQMRGRHRLLPPETRAA